MTREEAIEILWQYDVNFEPHPAEEVMHAIDMAIEALKAEPILCKYCKHLKTMCEDEGTCYYWCKQWNNATDDWGYCYYGERREP